MRLCVECGVNVQSLSTEYCSDNIRLTQCSTCGEFADKYIEYDGVLVFIDLLLLKHQVYRHILFNRRGYRGDHLQFNTRKLAIILILFEVYLKLVNIELTQDNKPDFDVSALLWQRLVYINLFFICQLLLIQANSLDLFIFFNEWLEWFVYYIVVKFMVQWWARLLCKIVKTSLVLTALIISSFGKLLLLLMVIWDSKGILEYSWLVSGFVLASNIEALSVVIEAPYASTVIILSAALVKFFVQYVGLLLEPTMSMT